MENIFTNFKSCKLEFDKILFELSGYALSDKAKEYIINTIPIIDFETIKERHFIVSQLKKFIIDAGKLDLPVIYNFSKALNESKINSVIEAVDLYKLSYSVKKYFELLKIFENSKYHDLALLFSIEKLDSNFYIDVLKYVTSEGYIESGISQELKRIRNEMHTVSERVKKETEIFFRDAKNSNYTADDIVSERDGISCIAVKSNYKNKVEGIILDTSATGQTVFIAPKKVIELNNELFLLRDEEKKEIYRILSGFTKIISDNVFTLEIIDAELLTFDVFYAVTRYSSDNGYNSPEFSLDKQIKIYNGRHPLLGKKAVPLDISFGEDYNLLIITGPNTGGKTVVLKTIGLFVLMVQSGLPIPASSGSQFSVFKKIFLDIGDDQSIESSLSTFSGHITKIIDVLKNADRESLLLLDELCSGTDPLEGSALALSVIKKLIENKALGIITTHYSAIKHFASQEEGIENASMEFDAEKLEPTYKLKVGLPGSSKAFEISKRLGMPEDVIEDALTKIDGELINVEKIKEKLDIESRALLLEKETLLKEKNEIESREITLLNKEKSLKEKEDEIKDIFMHKEASFLKESRREFEELVKKIRTENASKESILSGKDLFQKIEKKVNDDQTQKESKKAKPSQIFAAGDKVKIISKKIKAVILSQSNKKNEYLVQAGVVKLNISSSDLEALEVKKNENKNNAGYKLPEMKVQKTLDLRGKRYEEALRELEIFIEEAMVNNVSSVRIIHGIGTGAIKNMIQDFCCSSPVIDKYDYEKSPNETSTNFGVTVAELKY